MASYDAAAKKAFGKIGADKFIKGGAAGAAAAYDDDVDLIGSDSEEEEDAEAARVREERLAAYAAKKSKKPGVIAKTSVLLDVKPWADDTDMDAMLNDVKATVEGGLPSSIPPQGENIDMSSWRAGVFRK